VDWKYGLRTCALGDREAAEAVATPQTDPGEALGLKRLEAGRDEQEGAVAAAEEIEAAALEHGELE
jgi:hypothetical protein